MATSSAVPQVVDALVAALSRADALRGVQVADGPLTTMREPSGLIVGVAEEGPAVIGAQSPGGLGSRRRETFEVGCRAWVWVGDNELKPVRDEAFRIVDAVGAALAADRTLGGAVMQARLGEGVQYDPRQSEEGAWVVVDFGVRCEAFVA